MLGTLSHMFRSTNWLRLDFMLTFPHRRTFDVNFSVRIQVERNINFVKCWVLRALGQVLHCPVLLANHAVVESLLQLHVLISSVHKWHRVIETFVLFEGGKLLGENLLPLAGSGGTREARERLAGYSERVTTAGSGESSALLPRGSWSGEGL